MISVRSEVQILPGPPRPNDAKRRSCRAASAARLRGGSGSVQKRAPDKCAVLRGAEFSVEFVAWCLIWRGAALAVAAQPLPPPRIFGRQGPPCRPGGCSSVGRAPALQAGGHRFDSVHLHHRRNALSRVAVDPGSGALCAARGARGARAGVLSCTVRLSRLRGQPLAPPGAASAAPYDRVKQFLL